MKTFDLDKMMSAAMARINRHIEFNASSLESAYASDAHHRLTIDTFLGGPLGLNRDRVKIMADKAILEWL